MALAATGYSGTPLAAKLGLKDGMDVAFVALPAELSELAASRDFASVARPDGWSRLEGRRRYDFVHGFSRERAEVEAALPLAQEAIRPDGVIWVSWPKKASKVPTDLTEDAIRDAALRLDLVDVKVAAVDEVWSGLKLVIRKDRRKDG
jgi:hypothetical protein